MDPNIPRLRRFVEMPGPNLFAPLPGATLEIDWPGATLSNGTTSATQAALRLFETPALQAGAPVDLVEKLSGMKDGRSALDRLVELLAGAVIGLSGQPPAPLAEAQQPPRIRTCAAIHHRDPALAAYAGRVALTLATIGMRTGPARDTAKSVDQVLQNFRRRWQEIGFGDMNWRKLDVIERRCIPWRRLIPHDRTLQLGYGVRQTLIRDSMTGGESYIATYLATNKGTASEVMHANGLPAPRNLPVPNRSAAVAAARTLGYPVVVKPAMTDFGTAVSVNLRSDNEVASAFDQASRHGTVIVEQHVPGMNFRFLIIDGKFVAAVRQDPAHVVGDGVRSVNGLVQAANSQRSEYLSGRLKKIKIDEAAHGVLKRQGLTVDSVPAMGQRVLLREHSNLSVGGTYENVTNSVHADNRALAERAGRVFGLKMAGIDFISVDVARSYLETGGKICEINPSPGFVMGMPGLAAEEAFLDSVYPEGEGGRIPIVAILSDQPNAAMTGRLEAMAIELGHVPAVAMPDAIRCGGRTIAAGRFGETMAASAALHDPCATTAIIVLSRRGIAREGLAFDRCALSIVIDESGAGATGDRIGDGDQTVRDLLRRHSEIHLPATGALSTDGAVRAALLEKT